MGDARQRALRQRNRRVVRRALRARFKQGFERFGELGDAIEADDAQRTLNLVQMRAAERELRQLTAADVLLQRLVSARQRQIDLVLDPVERANVEGCRNIHEAAFSDLRRRRSIDLEAGDRALEFGRQAG